MRMSCSIECLGVLLIAPGILFGQAGATGTILGTVTDGSGAIIAYAKVTVTNTESNVDFKTVTTSSGDFNAPSLNPGAYKVTVEEPGFEKSVTNGLVLTVNQKLRVDAQLKPGAVTITIETSAHAVALNTDSTEVSSLVNQQQVEELPLNGRNFIQLLFVGEGTVTVGGE